MEEKYINKYLKYKKKYLNLINQLGGYKKGDILKLNMDVYKANYIIPKDTLITYIRGDKTHVTGTIYISPKNELIGEDVMVNLKDVDKIYSDDESPETVHQTEQEIVPQKGQETTDDIIKIFGPISLYYWIIEDIHILFIGDEHTPIDKISYEKGTVPIDKFINKIHKVAEEEQKCIDIFNEHKLPDYVKSGSELQKFTSAAVEPELKKILPLNNKYNILHSDIKNSPYYTRNENMQLHIINDIYKDCNKLEEDRCPNLRYHLWDLRQQSIYSDREDIKTIVTDDFFSHIAYLLKCKNKKLSKDDMKKLILYIYSINQNKSESYEIIKKIINIYIEEINHMYNHITNIFENIEDKQCSDTINQFINQITLSIPQSERTKTSVIDILTNEKLLYNIVVAVIENYKRKLFKSSEKTSFMKDKEDYLIETIFKKDLNITAIVLCVTEYYTLLRIFKNYDVITDEKQMRSPAYCEYQKSIIIFGGNHHIENIHNFFNTQFSNDSGSNKCLIAIPKVKILNYTEKNVDIKNNKIKDSEIKNFNQLIEHILINQNV